MPCLKILEYPDARLRIVARPVERFDGELQEFIASLFETLHASGGIGLAASQVDVHQQIIAMDLSREGKARELFINPLVIAEDVLCLVEESCLSVPGIVGNVKRSAQVRVRAQDAHGEQFERDLADLSAVCVQHEIDHLRGVLFVDRLSLVKRWRAKWALGRRAAG